MDRFIKLLMAGRPAPPAVEPRNEDGTMTLAELGARVGVNVSAREDPATRAWSPSGPGEAILTVCG